MEQKAMVKRTDLILSVGILVLVLLALALMVATGSTGEFVAWAWERHHNVLSWYIRPLFFWEPGGLQPSVLVSGLVVTMAVTFWYTWMFNHTGGSVLITLISHASQGTIQIGALWPAGADLAQANLLFGVVASAVAIGLVVFDWKSWRGPAAPETTTPPQAVPPRAAAPATPA